MGTEADSVCSIGALAARTGVNAETIRYYERIGLLPRPRRTDGGHRLYDHGQRKRLVFIRRARELGFSVEEVRELLRLVDGGDHTCAEVKSVTVRHLADVRRKLADLGKLERTLGTISARCAGGLVPDCPILDALFEDGLG
ncbi:MAG: helix-turn-helix domain-containing protein [Nitrospirae bacterium]|nr:helix-turn-helix domain-containing protein [Nitrospirota bacterium]